MSQISVLVWDRKQAEKQGEELLKALKAQETVEHTGRTLTLKDEILTYS